MTASVRWLLIGAAILVVVLGASFQTHSWPSTIMVLIPSAGLLVIASRQPTTPMDRDPALNRGLVLWSVLVGATLLWEAYAFVRQPDWSRPSQDFPTMSTLLDPGPRARSAARRRLAGVARRRRAAGQPMTDRTIIISGFLVLLALILAAVVRTHLRRDRFATVSATLGYLIRTRPAKIIAVLIWAWLGWHFLAR